MRARKPTSLAVAFLLLLGTAGVAVAQEETGNVYVRVLDTDGAPLPGVTVELSGMGAPRIMVTNTAGEARFLGLDPGQVSLRASLEGFSTVEYPNIEVRVARNTAIEVQLSGAIGEVITVTSESPLLDERKVAAGTTITQVELESIPTARDPWSVLNQTPSVVTDRINVGGNESGQQAVFRAPAVSDDENDFMVDGVVITDMAAIGSSSTYFDFDQFTEMQFSTGGTDVTKASAGVSLNLVTKRGTNEFRGSGRYFLTDADGYFGALEQGDSNIDSELAPGQESLSGNQINNVLDFGFEAGGPVMKDRVWLWGSWGKNDIKMFAAGGTPDDTFLENSAIKVNAQLMSANSLVASFNNGEKQKFGRNAGPGFDTDATWNQRGPTGIYKVEDTHVFNSNLFLTGTWSKVDGGFAVVSQGVVRAGCSGLDCPFSVEPLFDEDFVRKNSYYQYPSSRPSEELKADGSYFFNSGSSMTHELKYGARLREFESSTQFLYPGRNIAHYAGVWWGISDPDIDVVEGARGSWPSVNQNYTSLWAQDTMSLSKWTINAGLRWDIQDGENPAELIPANPAFPEILPAIDFPGNDADGLEWNTISPRVGVTYALGEERKTLIRGSYSRFAQALYNDVIGNLNPTGFSWAYQTFEDLNGNNMWDGPEEPATLFGWSGFDPEDPTAVSSPNRNDPGLDPAMTDEIILGAEHSFLPEFVVGANFTMRQVTDIIDDLRLIRDASGVERVETLDDYVIVRQHEQTLPDGTVVNYPEWNLREGLSPTGGTYLTNGGREREYTGIGLNWTKRLANQWMMRGFVNYALTDKWIVPDTFMTYTEGRNPSVGKSDCDGCTYAVQSAGSGNKSDVYLQTGWSWNLNGMYQVMPDRPWGFNVAANLYGRQGTALPYYDNYTGPGDGINRSISVVADTDDFRTDDVFMTDVRLEKEFAATSGMSFTFSIDGFNVFNENYVLQRERRLNSSRANYLDETVSPRIWRLGVRLNWR
jgi:hypothetical protein